MNTMEYFLIVIMEYIKMYNEIFNQRLQIPTTSLWCNLCCSRGWGDRDGAVERGHTGRDCEARREGRRGVSGSAQGPFQREDSQDHGGEKGRLEEDARAFWCEHQSKSQSGSLGKTGWKQFWGEDWDPKPRDGFSNEVQTERLSI